MVLVGIQAPASTRNTSTCKAPASTRNTSTCKY